MKPQGPPNERESLQVRPFVVLVAGVAALCCVLLMASIAWVLS
jgi:hypothetical protein